MIESLYFEQPLALLATLLGSTGIYLYLKASNREGKILAVTRAMFFILLAVGLAGPHIQDQRTVDAQNDLVVLEDKSRSAQLMENSSLQFDNVNVERRTVLTGNNSKLASALDSELREDTEYLLLSDGRTSQELDSVLEKYRADNSSISVLKPEMDDEKSVGISGPSTTVPGARNNFEVNIRGTTAGEVPIRVELDNQTVFEGSISDSWSFNRTFESEQSHRIKAQIETQDRWRGNNEYYKTVQVDEKPEVLYIGEESDLTDQISRFYDLMITDELPEDLDDYYSVISSKALNSDSLSSYISEGNGYMYLGGYGSPADYLPVEASNEDYDTESARVVVGMETSSQAGESIRDSKDLAYALVEELPLNTKVGAYHYSQDAHIISELTTLAYNRDSLLTDISRVQSIAETRHGVGLQAGKQLADGQGNLVLFTDGNFFKETEITGEEIRQNAFAEAENMEVDLYVVGVGEDPNSGFLRELADRAPRGEYISSDNVWRLGFRFGAGGGTSAFKPLLVFDEDHFITRDIGLDSSVSIFDEVKPKNSADVLVSGPGQREFLTSWNYGLGRVAAFSGGQPLLSRVMGSDPSLVTRTASWTVGNPNRNDDRWVRISNTESPSDVEVTASYDAEGLSYSSQNRYKGEVSVDETGFHTFEGKEYSYNYNSEIKDLGYRNQVLEDIASSTGGEVYTSSTIEEKTFEEPGTETVSYERPLSVFFIVAAMVVLLSEIGYRKLNGKK